MRRNTHHPARRRGSAVGRTRLLLFGAFLPLAALGGCARTPPPLSATAAPASASPPGGGGASVGFADVTSTAGVLYRWEVAGKRPLTILQTIGNGVGLLDFDGDGNLDILLVGSKLALYRGDGKSHFSDVTQSAGLDRVKGQLLGCGVGDWDNDGDPDLYLTAYRGGALLRNEGGQRFADVTAASRIPAMPWSTSCAFADVDGDGRLDLYVGGYVVFGPHTRPQLCDFSGIPSSCGPRFYQPERGKLFLNRGQGRFEDVTARWGANVTAGKALGVAFADFDGSGRESLALANDEVAGDLFRNTGGRFVNVGVTSGVAYDADGSVHGGMGTDWGDYDNDGRLDLVVATFVQEPNCIYRNEGDGLFAESSGPLGLAERTLPYVAFGAKWLDFDNDGWLDLMLTNGHVQDNIHDIDRSLTYRQPTQLFRNVQGESFDEVTAAAGEALRKPIVGRGLATGDFDNDGRVDAVAVDSEGTPLLLRNETPEPGHWLRCRLVGTRSPRDGTGALVTVVAGNLRLVRRCGTDGSYLSASDPRVHFGLGPVTRVTLRVRWPSGAVQEYRDVAVDRQVEMREGSPELR